MQFLKDIIEQATIKKINRTVKKLNWNEVSRKRVNKDFNQ